MNRNLLLIVASVNLAVCLAAQGCTNTKRYTGVSLFEEACVIEGVPSIRQSSELSCGPACVASVALYWTHGGIQYDWGNEPSLNSSETSGTDLCAAARSLGLDAFAFSGTLEDLEANVRKGRPVIIMAYCGEMGETVIPLPYYRMVKGFLLDIFPPKHWVIVIGIVKGEWFVVQDSAAGRYLVKRARLLSAWAKNDYTAVLVATMPNLSSDPSDQKAE